MLTKDQMYAVYEFHSSRRHEGPIILRVSMARPKMVQDWLNWRAMWWHEINRWLDLVNEAAAQRGEGDIKPHPRSDHE